MTEFLARQERFASVGSTNDVVRDWLAEGRPRSAWPSPTSRPPVAAATAGPGRRHRARALLLSLGFRPTGSPRTAPGGWAPPRPGDGRRRRGRRRAAGRQRSASSGRTTSSSMADRPAASASSPACSARPTASGRTTRARRRHRDQRRLAGADFPAELADSMTSLRELSGGPADRSRRAARRLPRRLEAGLAALRDGRFDAADWAGRQLTNGRDVQVVGPDGRSRRARGRRRRATRGALARRRSGVPAGERQVVVGEIRPRPRLAGLGPSRRGVTRWRDWH